MLKAKKIIAGMAASAAMACILAVNVFAYSGAGTVNVRTSLNIRGNASTYAPAVGRLYSGSRVSILGSYGGWYKVSANGVTGWVYGQYVDVDQALTAVSAAKSVMGVRYVFGGTSVSQGFDCSGLTMYAYARAGITLPHSAAQQAVKGTWVSRANLKPGDLIFFDTNGGNDSVNHCGIYIGGGSFIQAESGSVQKVTQSSLSNTYWSSHYMTARRIAG